jgi:competence protein ComEA
VRDELQSLLASRRHVLVVALVALLALLAAGRFLAAPPARDDPQAGVRPVAVAAPPPALLVHVVGAVRRPGLYRLREGSRIADAVDKAGGATRKADLTLVNLAAPVSDGTQVVVPRRVPAPAGASGGTGGASAPSGPVHLNTATLEELDTLPGVGPVTAQKILDWRQENGAFSAVDELDAIPGIGPKRLEQLRELVAP